jgi:CO/xanthine dehydrogenase FAD-binding subunit
VRLHSPRGERLLPVSEFIAGPLDTALAEDEFIHSARVALPPASAGTAFIELSRRHGDFALAAAAAVIDLNADGRVRRVHAGVSGGQGFPIRIADVESALAGEKPTPRLIEDSVRTALASLEVDDDGHIPAGYRRLLLTTVLERALQRAAERAEQRHVY